MKAKTTFAKTAALMGIIILFAKCMGLIRDILVASVYGTTLYAVAYETASKLPITVFDLVLGGVVTSAFIPVYHSIAHDRGKEDAVTFTGAYLNFILLITTAISVIGVVFAPMLVSLLAPGLDAATQALSVSLTQIMFPMVIFVGMAFTFVGFLQAEGEYNIPAVISLVSNLIMVGYLVYVKYAKPDPMVSVRGLAIMMLVGWLAQAAVQIPSARKRGLRYHLLTSPFTPDTFRAMKNALPILAATWTAPVCTLINTRAASLLKDGAISALGYANRLYIIIVGLFSFVATNLLFPYFSRAAAEGNTKESDRLTRLSMRILTYIIAPISVGVAVLARPFVALIYENGAFGASDTAMTAGALAFYAVGMLFTALCEVLTKAFFAAQKTKYPMIASLCALAFNGLLLFIVVQNEKLLSIEAIALISGLAAGVQLLAIYILARKKKLIGIASADLSDGAKSIVSALLMGGAVYGVYRVTLHMGLLSLGLSVCIGVIAYILLTAILKSEETKAIFAFLKKDHRKGGAV